MIRKPKQKTYPVTVLEVTELAMLGRDVDEYLKHRDKIN
jgi:hypothetical protein